MLVELPLILTPRANLLVLPSRKRGTSWRQNYTCWFAIVRQSLRDRNISSSASDLILRSWRPSTRKQYDPAIRKWTAMCNARVMKGVFEARPALPRYSKMWDVSVVLRYMSTLALSELSSKDLTYKTVTLLALASGQRLQTSNSKLLISFVRPYKPVSTDTLSRWIKNFLSTAGVDISVWSAHSTRDAAASKIYTAEVSLDVIMKGANWKSADTLQNLICGSI
ncbi:uncharacterized protein LOC141898985 [Tubulanus polymorphus]|uniref:uncharacterized protein LOC141898985 n=1 Tax=Tubulanus polymorphus TaxID=672921 RepID=UPI003DA51371